jgi:hypothetical protein
MKVVAFIIVGFALAYTLAFFTMQQSYRLLNRTVHERQFNIGGQEWERDLRDIRKFEVRHGLRPEVHSGLRLVMDEWPSWKYLISVEVRKDGVGRGAILAEPYDGKGKSYERPFELKKEEAEIFLETFDHEIEGFWGTSVVCTDGTSFQFERWTTTGLSSGVGNAACQKHYAELMGVVAEALAFHLSDAPFDWRSWFWSRRMLTLHENGR